MAKKTASKKDVVQDIDKVKCNCCGRLLANSSSNFYKSNSILNKHNRTMTVCKNCISALLSELVEDSEDIKIGIYKMCRLLDIPYSEKIFNGSFSESGIAEGLTLGLNGLEVWKKYIKNVNSLPQYKTLTFENGDIIDYSDDDSNILVALSDLTEEDKQNEKDVIKMLRFDPFINESKDDRRYLFNRIVDMIDDSVIEDNMKLMSIIEIVKGFNQIDKINGVISSITSDLSKLTNNSGNIKTLVDTKKNLTQSLLKIAEDNRITEKFSGTSTVGAGTLSGMIKKLSEINLEEAQVNLYDIKTSYGMRQVADLSLSAIWDKLTFAENDYADMIAYQNKQLQYYSNQYESLSEENRKLKVLCNANKIDYSIEVIEAEWNDALNFDEDIQDAIIKKQLELEDEAKKISNGKLKIN